MFTAVYEALWELLWGKLSQSKPDPMHSCSYWFFQILFFFSFYFPYFLLCHFESRKSEKISERDKAYVYSLCWEYLPLGNRKGVLSEISIVLNHYISKQNCRVLGKMTGEQTDLQSRCSVNILNPPGPLKSHKITVAKSWIYSFLERLFWHCFQIVPCETSGRSWNV